jgi:hypothetical protein
LRYSCSWKVSGFTSFNATVPCNKCSTAFPARYNTNFQRDFSFGLEDLDTWSLRTNIENRHHARNWKEASTKKQRDDWEQKFGTRFSALHGLEYLDLVRCTAIDPMHDIFLGKAKKKKKKKKKKKNIKIWRTTICDLTHELYLTDTDLKEMQKEANDIILPAQYMPIN